MAGVSDPARSRRLLGPADLEVYPTTVTKCERVRWLAFGGQGRYALGHHAPRNSDFPTDHDEAWHEENLKEIEELDDEIKQLERKITQEADDLEVELLQIELEEKKYARANMELVARDRVREIEHWSRIKSELDDGSFDNKNVNTHQMTSMRMALQNRAKALTSGSSQAEVINVLGPLETANRLAKQQKQKESLALLEEMSPDIMEVPITESVAIKTNE